MSSKFLRADEIAEILDVSPSYAYRLIRELNMELDAKGYMTIPGRINSQYFYERFYTIRKED
ncbi:MAG: helix-turn-helix domain-containing protein [Clostridiales bacterium]|nr:helix-turn-helix domain-containing protein [Clostridiales bacterium]